MVPGVSPLTTPGFVYFVQGDDDGLIKIGWSTNPESRRRAMQAHSALHLRVLHFEPGTGLDERAYHHKFKHLRHHGEWFAPAKDLRELVNERAGKDVFQRRVIVF